MPPKIQPNDTENDTKLSKEQEEEMNSALIARLLAQDAMDDGGSYYYAEYSNNPRHYDAYNGNNSDQDDIYDNESDDYAPKKYVKAKKSKGKKAEQAERRGRKRKNAPMDIDTTAKTTMEPTEPTASFSEPGNKTIKPEKPKKVKKPLPPGFKTGTYTDEEEVLFLEGLNLHGRNWNDLARHMGTRDPHSIRSHAQKHFIKLYRDNLPLPDKVKESGEGFTLSGKPLDPESAAAKPYLNRSGMGSKAGTKSTTKATDVSTKGDLMQIDSSNTCGSIGETSNGTDQATADLDIGSMSLMPSKQKSQVPASTASQPSSSAANQTGPSSSAASLYSSSTTQTEPSSSAASQTASSSVANQPSSSTTNQTGPSSSTTSQTGSSSTTNRTRSSTSNSRRTKQSTSRTRQDDSSLAAYDDNGRTNYAASRLRRPENRNSMYYETQTPSGDQLIMVKCAEFKGEIGSDELESQPFRVVVHSNALLTMDFHAHLMTSEIIGFLAGEWDRTSKQLTVKAAFPCGSLNTGQNDVNVEMDPTSDLEVRQLIENRNMKVVGWYHSHPVFLPDPSLMDIENQLNYQILCRDDGHTMNDNTSASTTPVNIVQDSVTESTSTTAAVASSSSSPPLENDNDNTQQMNIPELSNNSEASSASTSSAPSPSSATIMEPFVGAIVGPYDPRLPAASSVFNWFHVANNRTEKKIPKQLAYDILEDSELTLEEENRLLQLPDIYQDSPERVDFGENWRKNSQETKLEKMIRSLGVRMPWLQRRLRARQQGNAVPQNGGVDGIQVGGGGGGNAMDGPVLPHEMDMCTDAFLERVQAALMYW